MSIRKRKSRKSKNGYVYEVYFTFKNHGITERYSKSGFLTKKEAQNHEALKKAELQKYGSIKKEISKTLNEVFEEFLELGYNQYQPTTVHDTKVLYRHIKKSLGGMAVNQIDYATLQRFFNRRKDKGIETNKNIKKALNRILNYAIKAGYIENNPLRLVDVTGIEIHHNHNEILEFNDFLRLINALIEKNTFKYQAYSIAIQIAYFTGLRISEVLALNKSDFDFSENFINVNKKLIYSGLKKSEFYVSEKMKSKKSKAVIPLADSLKKNLEEWFDINPYEKVIVDVNGFYINPNVLSMEVKDVAKKLNIDFHFHMLRHTFATNLVTNNVDLKTAQDLMRHSNINTTMSIYAHINDEHKRQVINDIFNANCVENVSKVS